MAASSQLIASYSLQPPASVAPPKDPQTSEEIPTHSTISLESSSLSSLADSLDQVRTQFFGSLSHWKDAVGKAEDGDDSANGNLDGKNANGNRKDENEEVADDEPDYSEEE